MKQTAGWHTASHGAVDENGGVFAQSGWVLLWALCGLLFPRATAYGVLAPFGIGLVGAVTGNGSALVGLTAGIGYLMLSNVDFPLRYALAIALIGGVRWAFFAFERLVRHPVFSPVLTFVATASGGLLTAQLFASDSQARWLAVSEAAGAAGVAFLLRYVIDTAGEDPDEMPAVARAGWLMIGAVLWMSLSDIRIAVITPANVVAGMFILMMANALHERGGAVLGVTVAASLILMHPDRWQTAMGYAFGGLIAGAVARFGKPASITAWTVATTLVALSGGSDTAFLVGVYEAVAAGVLYLVVPRSFERRLARGLFGRGPTAETDGFRRSVTTKLDLASRVMEEVCATVDTVAKHIDAVGGATDVGSVYRDAAADVCEDCGSKLLCWKRHYADTMASLNDLTPVLREKSVVSAGDVSGHLARNCPRVDELAGQITRRYTEYAVRDCATRRLREIRSAVRGQFAGMSGIFSQFSADLSGLKRVDADTAARVLDVCEAHRLPIVDAVCLLNTDGNLTVELLSEDRHLYGDAEEWLSAVESVCDTTFCTPVVTPLGNGSKITLHQATRYVVSVGAAQHVCQGETVCGDAYEYFGDEDGNLHVVLSDGMGSGGKAAVDGAMTAGLTARMLGAGFGMTGILPIVQSALMVGSADETAGTLDVLTLNLFSGDIRLTKAGACATIVVSRGRVSRLQVDSLPIGILRESFYEQIDDRVVDGDVLLMMSDGAVPDGDEWLLEWLQQTVLPTDMNALAQLVVDRALCRQPHPDDITVVAVRVEKRE